MARTSRAVLGGLGAAAAALLAAPAQAALIPLAFDVEVLLVDAAVTTVADGDRFAIAFTIDDTAVDDQVFPGGHFPGLLTSFTMTADPANTGSWTPSGDTLVKADGSMVVTCAWSVSP